MLDGILWCRLLYKQQQNFILKYVCKSVMQLDRANTSVIHICVKYEYRKSAYLEPAARLKPIHYNNEIRLLR